MCVSTAESDLMIRSPFQGFQKVLFWGMRKGNKAIGHPGPTPPPGSGIGEQAEDGLVEEHRDGAPPLGGRGRETIWHLRNAPLYN